jgi:hypothetical protein
MRTGGPATVNVSWISHESAKTGYFANSAGTSPARARAVRRLFATVWRTVTLFFSSPEAREMGAAVLPRGQKLQPQTGPWAGNSRASVQLNHHACVMAARPERPCRAFFFSLPCLFSTARSGGWGVAPLPEKVPHAGWHTRSLLSRSIRILAFVLAKRTTLCLSSLTCQTNCF